ncbi:hypothetical protein V6N13_027528 [Hibiscus sabdariffa]|uniref:SHSP domain-containing protein n=1 Tax=Hibiscus sabdariffa TaxID=183260 RepID=A0ABR2A716_9ROSI
MAPRRRSRRGRARNYEQRVVPANPDEKANVPEAVGPAMIYLPSKPTMEEVDNALASTGRGIALTGAAATGIFGPIIRLVNLGLLEDSYYFRVSLPGMSPEIKDFNCEVDADGKVLIKGITTTGEKVVHRGSLTFSMMSQNLCPPGDFSVSFNLPGPVNPEEATGRLTDGMLEVIVKKK